MPDARSTSPLEAPAQRDQPPQEPPSGPPAPSARVPPWTRGFVALFLIAFLVCGVFAIEAWPLTGWKLFSHPRSANLYGWRAYTFDARGHETKIDFARFPRADRHLPLIMQTYGRLSTQRKDAVCQAWAGRMRGFGVQVSGVRIYRTHVLLRRHRYHRRPPKATRKLFYVCADGKGARRV
jgi:hypothetical protein